MTGWAAWRLDHLTWGWICWLLFFFAWEIYALTWHKGEELTEHLRPILTANGDLVYCLALGLWIWIGWHFLVDGVWIGQE